MVVADPIVSQAARWRTYYKTQDFTLIFLKTESTPAKVIMEDYTARNTKSKSRKILHTKDLSAIILRIEYASLKHSPLECHHDIP
jgi:hypothetical protein